MRAQRLLIASFTFAFGLVWILAFLLPSEIGGGIDRHGMYSPWLVGKTLYYTTGERAAGRNAEHDRGCFIAMLSLDNTATRRVAVAPSFSRRDDYFGAKEPAVVTVNGRFRMYYIGVGYDDVNRVCVADSDDGINWAPRDKAVFAPKSQGGPAAIWVSPDARRMYYIVFEKGVGVLLEARSSDGIEWEQNPNPVPVKGSAEKISGLPDGRLLIVESDGSRKIAAVDGKVLTGVEQLGLHDARAFVDNGTYRLLLVRDSADGILRTELYEGASLNSLQLAAGSRADGSVAALSHPAQSTYMNDLAGTLADFVAVVSAFGFGLGLLSLLKVHGGSILKKRVGSGFSGLVLVSAISMLITQLAFTASRPESGFWFELNRLLFYNLQFPLGSTMFGLLGAYLLSAAYRAFRIRTFDAAVLAAMAIFVMLTQVPTAQFLASFFSHDSAAAGAALDAAAVPARNWALNIANDAVQRAVGFGAFVGAIAMALRVWLSLDRSTPA
jgi:hypothetical protein